MYYIFFTLSGLKETVAHFPMRICYSKNNKNKKTVYIYIYILYRSSVLCIVFCIFSFCFVFFFCFSRPQSRPTVKESLPPSLTFRGALSALFGGGDGDP